MCGLVLAWNVPTAASAVAAELQVERVALFKNGLGFFEASVQLPQGETTVQLGQLPVPVHGTFWVTPPEDVQVRGLFAHMEEVMGEQTVTSPADLLRANPGRRVAVTTGHEREVLRGTVLHLPWSRTPEPADPRLGDARSMQPDRSPSRPPQPSLVLLETDAGIAALTASSIQRVLFEDHGREDELLVTTVSERVRRPSLRLELQEPAKGQGMDVSFLAPGITWAPSYRIDLSDPETAKVTSKAVLVNEVADLRGVQLELVTGFPNVAFAKVRSPVAMVQDLRAFLSSLGSRGSGSGGGASGGVLSQQVVQFNRPEPSPSPSWAVDTSMPMGGDAVEDLFFYPVEGVHLERGETAVVPLFVAEMPYEHIYTWHVDDRLDGQDRYRREAPGEGQGEEVWHSCRLVNTLDMPLTTAPAEFVESGRLVGQDIAYYTAPGAETTIRINRALNLQAEELELEVDRQRHASEFHGYHYDRVEIRGELKLVNRTSRTVRVEVTKELSGEVQETTPDARDLTVARDLEAVNPRHELIWVVDLEAGTTQTLTYHYRVDVRS